MRCGLFLHIHAFDHLFTFGWKRKIPELLYSQGHQSECGNTEGGDQRCVLTQKEEHVSGESREPHFHL